jgi:hypothetical protein
MKRAALYVRVSTDRQTVENQVAALSKVASARGLADRRDVQRCKTNADRGYFYSPRLLPQPTGTVASLVRFATMGDGGEQ